MMYFRCFVHCSLFFLLVLIVFIHRFLSSSASNKSFSFSTSSFRILPTNASSKWKRFSRDSISNKSIRLSPLDLSNCFSSPFLVLDRREIISTIDSSSPRLFNHSISTNFSEYLKIDVVF